MATHAAVAERTGIPAATVLAGDPAQVNVLECARAPEHIAMVLPLLGPGIAEERARVEDVRQAAPAW